MLIMTSDAAGTQEAPLLSFTDILRISAPSSASKLLRTSTQRFPAQHGQLHASLSPGDGEIRTLDPLLARQVLSQLSYTPTDAVPSSVVSLVSYLFDGLSRWLPPMGLSGLEPPTSRLSGVRSNRLSYKPI